MLPNLSVEFGFTYTVEVLPITVAALMTVPWVARHLTVKSEVTHVIVPGYCQGELLELQQQLGKPVTRGPKDLWGLQAFFGGQQDAPPLDQFNIEILAEINHVPRLSHAHFLQEAQRLARDGADLIDIGCDPNSAPWPGIHNSVRALKDLGLRVSIDSFDPREIEIAASAGAELVLSVNSANRQAAPDWGIEVVAIPDEPGDDQSLEETIEFLEQRRVRFRIDPILEPIGFGFFRSLSRYREVRKKFPASAMMMGIGNITELTDADSAGINLLLLCICQELEVQSVLTTQVIPWASSSVRECDLGRRIAYHAVLHKTLPKRLSEDLVMLRDPRLNLLDPEFLTGLAGSLRDKNIRIFQDNDQIHAIAAHVHLSDRDPFLLFQKLSDHFGRPITPSHAFYLGYEFCKASLARQLGKQYTQDEPLRWGFLTEEESHHRLRRDG